MPKVRPSQYSTKELAEAKQEFLGSEPNPSLGDTPDYSGVGIEESMAAPVGGIGVVGKEINVSQGFTRANYENLLNRVHKLELFMEIIRIKFEEYDLAIAQRVNDGRTISMGL